ncbi:hypothetical protein ISS85_01515, partial [Candidatus Microgenomates bacterium]|nr:hypothetical protein [Candidatus Microgenomates bacterium]
PTATPTTLPSKVQSQETGFLSFLRNILNFFSVGRSPAPTQPPEVMVGGPVPSGTIIAPTGRTLQLGTFEPLPLAKDCTEMYFRVVE